MATRKLERLKGETVEPIETLKLMRLLGVTKTAHRLGVSTTTLHKARSQSVVSRVIEVAAAGEMLREQRGKVTQKPAETPPTNGAAEIPVVSHMQNGATVIYLLEVKKTHAPTVEKFAEALKAKYLASE